MERTLARNQEKISRELDYLKAEIKHIRKSVRKRNYLDQFVDILSVFVMVGCIIWNLNNLNWSEKEQTNGFST